MKTSTEAMTAIREQLLALAQKIAPRFVSGNSVPVERAHITADEFHELTALADQLGPDQAQDDVARLRGELSEAKAACQSIYDLSGYIWDRTDGALIVFPENIPKFDAAFNACGRIAGAITIEDDAALKDQEPEADRIEALSRRVYHGMDERYLPAIQAALRAYAALLRSKV